MPKQTKEYREILAVAVSQGCTVKQGKHLKVVTPAGGVVIASKTPSDQHAYKHFKKDLEKQGIKFEDSR